MKRLFVSDLDGTLLDRNKKLTPYSVRIIKEIENTGDVFTIATGRTAGSTASFATDMGLKCPAVLMNGAMLYDFEKRRYVKYEPIDKEVIGYVCDAIARYSGLGFVYTFDRDIITAYYTKLDTYQREFMEVRRINDGFKIFEETDAFSTHKDKTVVYFVILGGKNTLESICRELSDKRIETAMYQDIYKSGDYYFLEIFSHRATKANGVLYLREYVNADEVIVFGDNLNDIDMLKAADIAIVPENGVEQAKRCANIICAGNDEDGVCKYIENFYNQKG